MLLALLLFVPAPLRAACADGARLEALGERMLEDSLALRFGEARQRVAEFGTWTYGWTQSYLTAYRIFGRAVRQLGEAAVTSTPPDADAITANLAGPVREAFRARVTVPSFEDGRLAADLRHIAATLAAELPDPPAARTRLETALRLDPAARLEDPTGTGTVFMRSLRPLAARLGAVALRLSEAGPAFAAGGYLGWSIGGVAGLAAGVTAGVGAAWTIDWAINRIDAGLHRAAFEAEALAAIDAAEAATLAEGRTALRSAIAAAGACR